jgi:hypothetical protein
MNRLTEIIVWIKRIGHCRGFGIQSPWAYHFVRYVINEHYPYYSYETLERQYPDASHTVRKLCRLYFRIANYRQPGRIILHGHDEEAFRPYLKSGCRKAEIIGINELGQDGEGRDNGEIDMLCMNTKGNYAAFYKEALTKTNKDSVVIIRGIYDNRQTARFWKSIMNNQQVAVAFDLYYCGIIFFDKKRYKRNYIINY